MLAKALHLLASMHAHPLPACKPAVCGRGSILCALLDEHMCDHVRLCYNVAHASMAALLGRTEAAASALA